MDEPLHVQVARALGWTNLHPAPPNGSWWGTEPYQGQNLQVPVYDKSWCSMGPIIERFQICVMRRDSEDSPRDFRFDGWMAFVNDYHGWVDIHSIDIDIRPAQGNTPCEAVAKLIVTLKKEGKLPND